MRAIGHHGVTDQERRVGNEFEINLSVEVPNAYKAMASDNLSDTINYAELVEIVKHEMSVPSRLIENVAGRIRDAIMQRWGLMSADKPYVAGGNITIAKLAPPIAAQLSSVSFTCKW